MKIRIKIALLLVWLAKKIHPQPSSQIESVEGYLARRIGGAVGVCKKDVKRYKLDHDIKSSKRAKAGLLKEVTYGNYKAIFAKAKELTEVDVYRDGEYTIVESRLNVYVPKESC